LNSVERLVEVTPALRETRDGVAQSVALEVLGVDVGAARALAVDMEHTIPTTLDGEDGWLAVAERAQRQPAREVQALAR
jgi:hypothetical protein